MNKKWEMSASIFFAEMGNRGSKSSIIITILVKEQRVDGSSV